MRAVVTEDFGAAPTIAELDQPKPGSGEVLVQVRASSLNGFDIAMASGYLRGLMEHEFPAVLGRDFAGTVEAVGEGVSAFAAGDDVFGVVLTQPLRAGGFAEYLVVPEDHNIAVIPAGLDHATAGITGLAGAAALVSVEAAGIGASDTVLVSGATGGVGAFAIQMALARGATVIGTARPGAEADHVLGLGAHHVVDYTAGLADQIAAIGTGQVDVALHYAGDPFALADLVVEGGRLATLLGIGPDQFGDRKITVHSVFATPERAVLDLLGSAVAAGTYRVPLARTYRLAEVPQAFADFQQGTLGKLAVHID